MTLEIYTKYGKKLHLFEEVDEITQRHNYYEVKFEGDKPWARIYGIDKVILIKS